MAGEPPPVREGRIRAEAVRYEHDLGDAPVRDLFGFIERSYHRVYVVRHPMAHGPEGALLRHRDRWLIIVNSDEQYLARQRFTASHELAHLLFDSDRDPVHIDQTLFGRTGRDPIEMRANAFAVHFLLPADALRERFHDPTFDVDDDEQVVALAMEYGLSLQSLAWHLKNVCGISDRQRRRIHDLQPFRIAGRMGLADRVRNETRAANAHGWPSAYISLVAKAFDRGLIDEDEVQKALLDDQLIGMVRDAS